MSHLPSFKKSGVMEGLRRVILKRDNVRFLLAGDLFSAVSLFAERFHFSVQALTQARFARFRRKDVRERLAANAALSTALATSCIAEDIAAGN